jgi:hypothetical protein
MSIITISRGSYSKGKEVAEKVIADLDQRVKSEVEREGVSRTEALHIIEHDDEERRKWSQYLYGINTSNPSLYDLVIHIRSMTTDDAASVLCNTVALDAVAALVKAALMDLAPDVDVVADRGSVQIHTAALLFEAEGIAGEIEAIARSINGVNEAKVGVKP